MIQILLSFLLTGIFTAEQPAKLASDTDILSYDERLEKAIDDFYQSNWLDAEEHFKELKKDNPDDPTPHFFISMKPFWKYFLVEQDQELANEFLSLSEEAIKLSEKQLENQPNDTTMVLMLSGLHGYRSLVAAGEKNYRVAVRSGMTGFNFTRQLLSLDSDRADARIGRGMFYYMVGSIPREMKWATNMVGLRGDMEQGFEELKKASESDSYISNDAKLMLMFLYDREQKYDEALVYAQKLTEKFPKNVIFKYKKAAILEKDDRQEAAKDVYKEIIELNNPVLTRITEKSRDKVKELEKFTLNQ